MSSPPQAPTRASVIRRLAAMLYDSLLIFGVLCAATLPAVLLDHLFINNGSSNNISNNIKNGIANNAQSVIENEQVVYELQPLVAGWPYQLYLLMVVVTFFCWFWRKNGQTLGMQAWRLKIEECSGNRISIKQCLQRLIGATFSLACFGIGYWWIWIDKDGMSWHDRWSKTRVVVLPKKTA